MPRSNSMSGLTPRRKFAIIENNLLEQEKPPVGANPPANTAAKRVPRRPSQIPAHIPPKDLLNSWPLLKRGRALMSALSACIAFGAAVSFTLLVVWLMWDTQGIVGFMFCVEGSFYLFSSWRFEVLNSQPRFGHEPFTHDAWGCFNKFIETSKLRKPTGELVMDVREYLNFWFRGAKVEDIKRDNVMDLLCYGFWYRTRDQLEAEGLGHVGQEMLYAFEKVAGMTFPEGYNPDIKFMAHLWEPVRHVYRPFIFYLLTEFSGYLTSTIMTGTGFVQRYHAGFSYYTFEGDANTAKQTHYKHDGIPLRCSLRRKNTIMGNPLPEAKPIVFLHGVGLGILPYVDFIYSLVCSGHPVIVVEYRHVAMKLCLTIPTCDEVAAGVVSILDEVGVRDACFVSHSYGTFVLARILKARPHRVFSACFIDPVCMGMFLPRLLSSFVYSNTRMDSLEHLLQDIARKVICREVGISTTMCRKFAWSDLNIWPDELPDGKSLVVFSGQDVLVPCKESMGALELVGGLCKVMYRDDLFHGEFLTRPAWKLSIVHEIVSLALGDTVQSKQEAEVESLVRKESLIASLGAMDDLNNPLIRNFEQRLGDQVRKTLSFPWRI